ncbi:GNAT family N-acetyltransferase [Nocardioides anomalus]|uniref:GNAT family N-acetyltransferase n=1 Tax=Nocardioides anomalus TaxID=2712223 RepID=A0A6G6WG70_9ACTN|nr:GNAT family N-acetyltransferase [Nocardioides anomalus]QIG44206.1 GNAT family N-acetyltransferase [Nocardioides anomalus]
MLRHQVLDRPDAAALVAQVAGWDAGRRYVGAELHAGDLGWHLRGPDQVLAGTVHGWWRADGLVAVAEIEDATARPRVRPDLRADPEVAAAVADVVDALPGEQQWSEAADDSALRFELAARGWSLDPDPWTNLWADGARWEVADRGEVVRAADDVSGRVTVQRHGFARSTFDEPSWHRMAAGPGYRPDLDLVVRHDGVAVAAGTAWLSVPGGPAYLEPLATHRDHRGRGYGRACVRALVDACLAAGASGLSVATPSSNTGGVAAYVSAGMVPVQTLQGLTRRRGA